MPFKLLIIPRVPPFGACRQSSFLWLLMRVTLISIVRRLCETDKTVPVNDIRRDISAKGFLEPIQHVYFRVCLIFVFSEDSSTSIDRLPWIGIWKPAPTTVIIPEFDQSLHECLGSAIISARVKRWLTFRGNINAWLSNAFYSFAIRSFSDIP